MNSQTKGIIIWTVLGILFLLSMIQLPANGTL